jgi:hypothetical protein
MQLQITDKFFNDEAISQAYREASGPQKLPLGFLTVWCSVAKRVLQTGQVTPSAKKLKDVSTIIEARPDDTESPAFKALEKHGMILISDTNVVASSLGDAQYEEWFKSYPYRDVNGRKVKVRGKSKVRFFNTIRTEEAFTQLMAATVEYAKLCNGKPKDPERFILNDFWKEYFSAGSDDNSAVSTSLAATGLSSEELDKLLKGEE